MSDLAWDSQMARPSRLKAAGLNGPTSAWLSVHTAGQGKAAPFPMTRGKLAFSPDGKTLATLTQGEVKTVILRDASTAERRGNAHIKVAGDAKGLAFSPDGAVIAVGSEDGKTETLQLFNVPGRRAPRCGPSRGRTGRAGRWPSAPMAS